jgi:RHS repeat-associated protein
MVTTKYIWDEDNLLAEADDTDAINVVYTNEPLQHGNLVSTRISGATSCHHFDATGSTRQLSNAAGTVTDTAIYDEWGNVVKRTGANGLNLLWIGELGYYYDVETGLFSIRERPYEPKNARWTAFDALGFIDSTNRFVYVLNNPVLNVDPSGFLCAPGKCVGSLAIGTPSGCKYFVPEGFGDPTDCGSISDALVFEFWMYAAFQQPCDCCRYKQLILGSAEYRFGQKGKWRDWNTIKGSVSGTPPNGYVEDVDKAGHAYGERPGPGYSADGCFFDACDAPGPTEIGEIANLLAGVSDAVQFRFDYKFRGQIIATNNCGGGGDANGVVTEIDWEAKCAVEFGLPLVPPFKNVKIIPYPQ